MWPMSMWWPAMAQQPPELPAPPADAEAESSSELGGASSASSGGRRQNGTRIDWEARSIMR